MRLTTKSGYTVETMARNIVRVVETATRDQKSDGLRWYTEAHSVAQNLANVNAMTLEQAAGIIAALSPRVRWERNVYLAWEITNTHDCPGLGRSRDNALAIMHGANTFDVLRGPKTRAFAQAIASAGRDGIAVVDVWAVRAATRSRFDEVARARYADVALAYSIAARRLGLRTHDAQAIAWVATREGEE